MAAASKPDIQRRVVVTRLHGRLMAAGDRARPLVLLHGFTGDGSAWEPFVAHLPAGLAAWAVDLVGHGESAAPNDPAAYTMANTVASLKAHFDEHAIESAHLVGYSMGGRVALGFAVAYPMRVASLILVGASPGLRTDGEREARRRADEALARELETEGLDVFVDRWMANPLFATQSRLGPSFLAAAAAQRRRSQTHALAHTLRRLGTGSMPPLYDALAGIGCPVLLVAGALDTKFTAIAVEMATLFPNATTAVVPDTGHAVHLEAPGALARLIGRHLDGNAEAPVVGDAG